MLHHGDCLDVMAGERLQPEPHTEAELTMYTKGYGAGRASVLDAIALGTSANRSDAITDLAAGTAAEHLVCADLLMAGYRAFLTDQNCPYDVAVELDGRLIRVQVKATRRPRRIPQRVAHQSAYLFHTRRAGKAGQRRYVDGDFDVLALVALDIRRVAYLRFEGIRDNLFIRVPGVVYGGKNGMGRQFDDLTFDRAVA